MGGLLGGACCADGFEGGLLVAGEETAGEFNDGGALICGQAVLLVGGEKAFERAQGEFAARGGGQVTGGFGGGHGEQVG